MRVLGIITEHNPFHNGHAYHIEKAKETCGCDAVVAVMSGHFVQRGEPALYDKWSRARLALLGGADLVLELPAVFATSSAEYFAFGAIDILNATGIVDTVCFGSESGDIRAFDQVMDILTEKHTELEGHLRPLLETGMAWPAAYSKAQRDLLATMGLESLHGPNNHLGLEYIRSARRIGTRFDMATITRIGSGYHDSEVTSGFASATALRRMIAEHSGGLCSHMPTSVFEAFKDLHYKPVFPESLFPYLIQTFTMKPLSALRLIHDMEPGLPERILQAGLCATSYTEFMAAVQTKRFTTSRLRRIMLKALLDIRASDVGRCGQLRPTYIRPLAFNENGRSILSRMKDTSRLPVLTRLNRLKDLGLEKDYLLDKDIMATKLYSLLRRSAFCGDADFTKPPVVL